MKRLLCALVVCMLAVPAWADWNVGDPYKMHYPQLPDPNGWDVRLSYQEPDPAGTAREGGRILADDWKCTQTGEVTDVHFWGSWRGDQVGTITKIIVMVYRDGWNQAGGYSEPLSPYHAQQVLSPGEFTMRKWGSGDQGFYDPWGDNDDNAVPYATQHDHHDIYQVNITNLHLAWDTGVPFIQQKDEVYWLGLEVQTAERDRRFGWKTSISPHFLDDAVYSQNIWRPLDDPITQTSLDLAFVITPEPATLGLLGLGALAMFRRRRS